jgi:hypothetical protein
MVEEENCRPSPYQPQEYRKFFNSVGYVLGSGVRLPRFSNRAARATTS